MKKLLLVVLLAVPALHAEAPKLGKSPAVGKPAFNKEKLQEIEQKIKAAEKKYHESVQATENAKKNNASKDEVAALEKKQEEAKADWQKEKSAK